MPTNFPASLDSNTVPGGSETLGGSSPTHPDLHTINNDAIEAIEAKVGTGASTPTTGKALIGTGTGTSAWGTSLTGTAGGAAEAGGNVVLTGGTGDSGNDAGASITVGGGSGDGSDGRITVVGRIISNTDPYQESSIELADRAITLTGGAGSTGEAGGDVSVTGGRGNTLTGSPSTFALRGNTDDGTGGAFEAYGGEGEAGKPGGAAYLLGGAGDDGNDAGASISATGGDGAGNPGRIGITSGGLTFQIIGGTADPSAGGGVAANVASLYARDNSGTGELWVKTGSGDTDWTQVV